MRSRSILLAVAVLLAAAPLSRAQVFFSMGPVPVYGGRIAYASSYLGAPVYGSNLYGLYGYNYAVPATAYRDYVLPRHARLTRALWIFRPAPITVTPSSTTVVDGSMIKVKEIVAVGRDWKAEKNEVSAWQKQLGGMPASPGSTDLPKSIKDALTNDMATAADAANLGQLYLVLIKYLESNLNPTVSEVRASRDARINLELWDQARKLQKTRELIETLLTEFLRVNNIGADEKLSAEKVKLVSNFLRDKVETLKQFP